MGDKETDRTADVELQYGDMQARTGSEDETSTLSTRLLAAHSDTEETFADIARQRERIFWFFLLLGEDPRFKRLCACWSTIIIVSIIVYGTYLAVIGCVRCAHAIASHTFYPIGSLYFVLSVAAFSVLPALYYNKKRVNKIAAREDVMVVDGCMRITLAYCLGSFLCTIVGSILLSLDGLNQSWHPQWIGPFDGERLKSLSCVLCSLVVLVLAFNMFFLLVDVNTSLMLLEELHELAGEKQLTYDKFNSVRTEIHERVKASYLVCNYVIVPALASCLGIAATIFMISGVGPDDGSAVSTVELVGYAVLQLKELLFVAVAFYYVAQVNRRADELTETISEDLWGQYNGAIDGVGADMNRVSVVMSALTNPISFTLAWTRVTWWGVFSSALGLGATYVVGIVKSIIQAQLA
jgi:hypothetical protein